LSLLRVNNSGLEAEDGAAAYGGYTKWWIRKEWDPDANPGPPDGRRRWPLFEGSRYSHDILAWSSQVVIL
jgi:hypothetical protein